MPILVQLMKRALVVEIQRYNVEMVGLVPTMELQTLIILALLC